MAKFSIKRGVFLVDIEGSAALVYYFGNRYLFEGRYVSSFLAELFSLLESPRSLSELREKFGSSGDLDEALEALRSKRLILDVEEGSSKAADQPATRWLEYFTDRGVARDRCAERLATARVLLIRGANFATNLPQALQSAGFGNLEVFDDEAADAALSEIPRADFVATAATWFDVPLLRRVNRICLETAKPWLNVLEDPFGGTIGPCFGVDGGPCFDCLLGRRRSHLLHSEKIEIIESRLYGRRAETISLFPPFAGLLANAAAVEMTKLVSDAVYSRTYRGLYELDFLNHRSDFHSVLPLPVCPSCSDHARKPLHLTGAPE